MHRAIVAALAAVIVAGCSSGTAATDPAPGPGGQESDAPASDPYQVWLEQAPSDAPSLSRDDALARAMLGCGTDWPPGTTDAILQDVYDVC